MAYTQTQLDALQAALASGTLSVSFEGRSVTYRSMKDLQSAIAVVQSAVNAAAGTPAVRVVRVTMDKGF